MSKISVIIPAYNASLSLRECLDSIVCQTHKDLEIILIDDCSSDDTYSIMREYAAVDNRIKLFRNDINLGSGVSRNIGLKQVTGEYVTFVDSDDFLELDTYRKVNDAILFQSKPDIIRFDQNSFLEVGKLRLNIDFLTCNIFNGESGLILPRYQQDYVILETPGVCNKVFKRNLVDEATFMEDKKWEDYPFCTSMLGKAERVVLLNENNCGYNYRHSLKHSSTTLSDIKKPTSKILDIFDCCDELEKRYEDLDLFGEYESAVRSSQKIHSLQRTRDIMFSRGYSHQNKKKIINGLIDLTEVKYGSVFGDNGYTLLKNSKFFYKARMHFVEKVYSDSRMRGNSTEDTIKEKILKMI